MNYPLQITAHDDFGTATYERSGPLSAKLHVTNMVPGLTTHVVGSQYEAAVGRLRSWDIGIQRHAYRTLVEDLIAQLGGPGPQSPVPWQVAQLEPRVWELTGGKLSVFAADLFADVTITPEAHDQDATIVAEIMKACIEGRVRGVEVQYRDMLAEVLASLPGARN